MLYRLVNGIVINLAQVTFISRTVDGIVFNFPDSDDYLVIKTSDDKAYQQVSAWLESLPSLSLYEG